MIKSYDKQEIYNMIRNFNNDPNVIELTNYYGSLSFMEILGVTRNEKVHSSFLAWLFDSNKNFGLGTKPLTLLLDLLIKESQGEKNSKKLIPEELNIDDIIIRKSNLTIPSVSTEYSIDSKKRSGFADIRIRFDVENNQYGIVIENKVQSSENESPEDGVWQTEKYYEYFENENKIKYIYVFLAPTHNGVKMKAHCEQFINISYNDIVNEIITPLLADNSLNDQTKMILNDYLKILNKPNIGNQKNAALVLAVSKYEEDIIRKIANNHSQLGNLLLNDDNDDILAEFINVNLTVISSVWPETVNKKNKNRTFAEFNIPVGSVLYLSKASSNNEAAAETKTVTTIDDLNRVEYLKDDKIVTKTITAAAKDLLQTTSSLNGFKWFIYKGVNLYNLERKCK